MINYEDTKAGDKLKIVRMGAKGFADLGDIVTVFSCNGKDRLAVTNDQTGEKAFFALTCGAQRLERVRDET